jgi:acetoin utilization protein AcuB
MRAKDWMAFDPVTVTRETTVREARTLMRSRGVRHLPVVGEGHVVGMLSDRDVRITDRHLEAISEAGDVAGVAGAERTVAEVMSAPAHVIDEDATVEDAARLMLSRRISSVPVVTADGRLTGLLTTTDCLLAFLSPGRDPESPGGA